MGVILCVCTQSCLTVCDRCGPPGSSVHGVSQARILEWLALASSGGSSQPRNRTCLSCVSCTDRRVLYLEQVGVGRASQQPEGISGRSEKLTSPDSKSEHLAGFPELEMEVGSRVSGGEDYGSQGQLVGVTLVSRKECLCAWEGTGFGWKGRWGPHGSGHDLQGGPIQVQPRRLCLCFGASQNIPVPSPSPTDQAGSNPSHLSPPACLAHNKLKNAELPAISVQCFSLPHRPYICSFFELQAASVGAAAEGSFSPLLSSW